MARAKKSSRPRAGQDRLARLVQAGDDANARQHLGERRFARNPLPTAPQVRPGPAPGSHRVEALRFHMAGEWRLVLSIEFEQIRDRAVLDVVVK
jgi:hypothetical protein